MPPDLKLRRPPHRRSAPGRHQHPPRRHVRRGRCRVLVNLKLRRPFVAAPCIAPHLTATSVSTDTLGCDDPSSRPSARSPTSLRHGLVHPPRRHIGLGRGTLCDGTPWRPATCSPIVRAERTGQLEAAVLGADAGCGGCLAGCGGCLAGAPNVCSRPFSPSCPR